MHACKIASPINSNNKYYITFDYLDSENDNEKDKIDINNIVNYIRLNYKLNKNPYVVEYDNIEYEILKTISTLTKTAQSSSTKTIITFKLLLKKLNDKLGSLPQNTECEITVFFKKEIDDPSLMVAK
jgi:hypothetical protein